MLGEEGFHEAPTESASARGRRYPSTAGPRGMGELAIREPPDDSMPIDSGPRGEPNTPGRETLAHDTPPDENARANRALPLDALSDMAGTAEIPGGAPVLRVAHDANTRHTLGQIREPGVACELLR